MTEKPQDEKPAPAPAPEPQAPRHEKETLMALTPETVATWSTEKLQSQYDAMTEEAFTLNAAMNALYNVRETVRKALHGRLKTAVTPP